MQDYRKLVRVAESAQAGAEMSTQILQQCLSHPNSWALRNQMLSCGHFHTLKYR